MTSEDELGPQRLCFSGGILELRDASSIVHTYSGATGGQKTRGCQPALPQSHDHDTLARQLHAHLNFSVARLNTASMIAMIQKRTMTRGSGQPFFSK